MATDKNSFILYCDILSTIEKLPDEKAGQLFKHLLNYVNDNNPKLDDLMLEIAFEPIKQSLKRDLKKYAIRQETARINGLKGGRPKKQEEPKETQKTQSVISKPRKAVSVSDSVSVSVKEKRSKRFVPPSYEDVLFHCNDPNQSSRFINHYESNGWKVGRNKMVNWKACLTNWMKRQEEYSNENNKPAYKTNYQQLEENLSESEIYLNELLKQQ